MVRRSTAGDTHGRLPLAEGIARRLRPNRRRVATSEAMMMFVQLHLGDIATWLAAVFTGGALFVGFLVLNLQRRDLRDRERDRLSDVEDRRKEQARQVSAWCDVVMPAHNGVTVVRARYQNISLEPVYEMVVYVKSTWGPEPSVAQRVLNLVPPGDGGSVDVQSSLRQPLGPDDHPPVLVTFHDAAGFWWKRDEHGVLTRWPRQPDVLAEMTPPPSE
jgi:hypothetical protein